MYTSWSVSQKANKWSSRNRSRWSSPEFDELHKAAQVELDPVKRAAMFIRMNDLVIASGYVIPMVSPKGVRATANKLNVTFSSWEIDSWALGSWSRDT